MPLPAQQLQREAQDLQQKQLPTDEVVLPPLSLGASPERSMAAAPVGGSEKREDVAWPHLRVRHMILSLLPQFVRKLYWSASSTTLEERRAAAMRDSNVFDPTLVLRGYDITDQETIKSVISSSCAGNPGEALVACARMKVADPDFVLSYARAVSSKGQAAVLCRIVSKLGLDPEQRLSLAETCARINPVRFVQAMKAFGIKSGADSYRFLKIAAMSDRVSEPGKGVLCYARGRGSLSSEQWLDILLTVADNHPAQLGAAMVKEIIPSGKIREKLLLAASRGSSIVRDGETRVTAARYIEAFKVEDSRVLHEAAREIATRAGGDLARFIHLFQLGSYARKEVLLLAAADTDSSEAFRSNSLNFGITDDGSLRRVGKAHARANGWLATSDLERFCIDSHEERRELALALVKSFGFPSRQHLAFTEVLARGGDVDQHLEQFLWAYGFTPLEAMHELLPLAAKHHPDSAIISLNELGLKSPEEQVSALKMIAGASSQGVTRVFHAPSVALTRDSLRQEVIFGAIGDAQDDWLLGREGDIMHRTINLMRGILREQLALWISVPEEIAHMGNVVACRHILQRVSGIDPRVDMTGWDLDEVRLSQPAAFYVVCAYHLARPLVQHLPFGTRVKEAVRLVSSHRDLPSLELSRVRFQQLCEVLGSCHYNQSAIAPAPYRISADAWRQSFREVLDLLVASNALASTSAAALPSMEQIEVGATTIAQHTKAIVDEAERSFARDFGLPNAEGIVKLQAEWGDLVPLSVLMGRFRSGRELEVPVLREIVKHVLAGAFYDWKYDPKAGQLGGMSHAQVLSWRRNPSRVSHCTAEQAHAMSEGKQLAEALALIDYSLLPHVPELYAPELYASRRSAEDVMSARLLSGQEFLQRAPSIIDVVCDLLALRRIGSRQTIFEYLRRYEEVKGQIQPIAPLAATELIRKDISRICIAVRERVVDTSKAYVVFSTITDHPKILLTIGDVVNVPSCLSYRSGSLVEALPGYVMDSNIKASLSFAVAENRIRSVFKMHKDEPFSLSQFAFTFNPARLALTVSRAGGSSLELDVGRAVYRHILRVGSAVSDGKPTVLVEQRYHQHHAVTTHIEHEQEELIREFREACGLEPASGPIDFPVTRNPGGVYSDAMGRNCRTAYRWEPMLKRDVGLVNLRDL